MLQRPAVMLSALAILLLVAATATVGALAGRRGGDGGPVACTEEAKLCPDGSAVGRNGRECRFDPCPLEQGAGVVRGTVTVGPLEPVERPDATKTPVPPEVYRDRWLVFTAEAGRYVRNATLNDDGTYAVWLWPGEYTVDINHAGIDIAKDLPKTIAVTEGAEIVLDVAIDTGIR